MCGGPFYCGAIILPLSSTCYTFTQPYFKLPTDHSEKLNIDTLMAMDTLSLDD